MSCIGCKKWKFNKEPSVLGIDLLYGFCDEKQEETAHNENCEAYEPKELAEDKQ